MPRYVPAYLERTQSHVALFVQVPCMRFTNPQERIDYVSAVRMTYDINRFTDIG